MKTKSIILIAISLGFGLVAAIGMTQVMGRQKSEVKKVEKEIDVLVAKRDIEIGVVLTAEDVVSKRFRPSQVPEGVATSIENIQDMRTTGRFGKGNFINNKNLIDRLTDTSISIPKGYSVYSVKPSIEATFQNTLRPGDRIDIIGVVRKGKSQVAKTFLKNIRVFGINDQLERRVSEDKISIKLVQVLLRPRQAEMLVLVQSVGKIHFVMRPDDQSAVELDDENYDETEETGNVSLDAFFNNVSDDDSAAKLAAAQAHASISWDAMEAQAAADDNKEKPHYVVFMTPDGPVEYVYADRTSQPKKVNGDRKDATATQSPAPYGFPPQGFSPNGYPPQTYPPNGEIREGGSGQQSALVNSSGQPVESGSSESSTDTEEAESK